MGVPDLDLIHILYITVGGKAVFVCHTVCLTHSLAKSYEKVFKNLTFSTPLLIFSTLSPKFNAASSLSTAVLSLLQSMFIFPQQNWSNLTKKTKYVSR